jgi:prepilin-type N-terminal cleavage/methylation domain-containing protein
MRKAFTLIEVMVVTSLFALVFGSVLYFTVIARESWSLNTTQVSLQQDLRRTIAKMTEELAESSTSSLVDASNSTLNIIQRDDILNIIQCIPSNQECVYKTVRFRLPTSRDSSGKVNSWSNYITYAMTDNAVTRQEGAGSAETILSNILLVNKSSGNGYTSDPNSFGSSFERMPSGRVKISLAVERKSPAGKNIKMKFGTIVCLRN